MRDRGRVKSERRASEKQENQGSSKVKGGDVSVDLAHKQVLKQYVQKVM
jgi:hypothetical protein